MKTKKCKQCGEEKDLETGFHNAPGSSDGKQTYCRQCSSKNSMMSKMLAGGTSYWDDGYLTEWEHFNAALEHYAEIFDCPALLKHKVGRRKAHRKSKFDK